MDDSPRSNGDGDEARLFELFRSGDPAATARAARQAALVVGLRGFAVPYQERAELVQDVITEMWSRLREPDFATVRAFDAYVRTLAYWRCIDWMRARRPTLPLDPQIAGRSRAPDERLLARERLELGRRVIRRLRESCRELIRLHAGLGLTYRQIGERLGRSEGALRVQMTDCLKEARRILRQMPGTRSTAAGQGGSP